EALSYSLIDVVFMGAPLSGDRRFLTKQFDRLTRGVVQTPVSPKYWIALVVRRLFDGYVKRTVEHKRMTPGPDVASKLIAGNGGDRLTDEELQVELVHFFLAGAPLASALAYHLMLLAENPDVMAKARAEVRRVAPDGHLSFAQLSQLEYVLRTCRESR